MTGVVSPLQSTNFPANQTRQTPKRQTTNQCLFWGSSKWGRFLVSSAKLEKPRTPCWGSESKQTATCRLSRTGSCGSSARPSGVKPSSTTRSCPGDAAEGRAGGWETLKVVAQWLYCARQRNQLQGGESMPQCQEMHALLSGRGAGSEFKPYLNL